MLWALKDSKIADTELYPYRLFSIHTPCPARYSVLHFFCVFSGGKFLVICLALLGVIFLLRKSDIAPCGRSDSLFALVTSNARSAYHCQRQYHARSAYHSPKANRVGAPALSQVRRLSPLWFHAAFFILILRRRSPFC